MVSGRGLIPVGPITSELGLMILVSPFQLIRFCDYINGNSTRSWMFCSQSVPVFLAVVLTASMCCFKMKINILVKWHMFHLGILSHASIDVTQMLHCVLLLHSLPEQ